MLAGWLVGFAIVLAVGLGYDLDAGWSFVVGCGVSVVCTQVGMAMEGPRP